MNKKQYTSAIKKTPYKYQVAKKIAALMLKGMDRNEIYAMCFDENYIEIDSLQRRREITNVVYERLSTLDNYLLEQFCNGDIITSKFILVYAIAKKDLLFFEFMFEVYREALLSEKHYISADDFDLFFVSKQETNETVAKWGHFTFECLTKGYRNILVESNFGTRNKRLIQIEKVMVHPDVIEHLTLIGDKVFIDAFLGGD